MHMSFCPDKPILAGFLGIFGLYQLPALAGRHDGLYMPAMAHSQQPTSCNAVRTGCSARDTLSQNRWLPARPATLMLSRDVRGASDAGQACPVLSSRQDGRAPRCRTSLRASWTAPCGSACRSGPRFGPIECMHVERYARNTIRTILCRGPPAWGGRGLTATPAGSLARRPAGGSRPVGAWGRGA